MVSKFPRGICKINAKVVGTTVTRRAPRSMLRHLSSISGVSEGIFRSIDLSKAFKEKLQLTFDIGEMYKLQQILRRSVYQMSWRYQKRGAVSNEKSLIRKERST